MLIYGKYGDLWEIYGKYGDLQETYGKYGDLREIPAGNLTICY